MALWITLARGLGLVLKGGANVAPFGECYSAPRNVLVPSEDRATCDRDLFRLDMWFLGDSFMGLALT
jgi:hypothetical protein